MLHGLNDEEVLESRQKFGDNKIIEAEPETFLDKFKDAFGDPMIKLLLAIACIMAIMAFLGYAEWGELIGIVISVLLVTGISAKTEMSSDNEYRKLKEDSLNSLRVSPNDTKSNVLFFNAFISYSWCSVINLTSISNIMIF